MRIGVGIDTGGTFTDAVLIDIDSGRILSKSKTETTYHDLKVGIEIAFNKALDGTLINLREIKAISLSTTLATNAIIEGRTSNVGIILIGMDLEKQLPVKFKYCVGGGHTITPEGGVTEAKKLDEEAIKSACNAMQGKVSAVAICEYFGALSPEHELRAKEIVKSKMNLPVTCGHELTSELGFYERAVTVALNANLIPLLLKFITAIEEMFKKIGMDAPIYMVKSDGTLTSVDVAKVKPAVTILTGPAASVIGAKQLTKLKDFVVIDQGGTTCLMAIIRDGWPTLDEGGATIANYKTRIRALNIRAIGLGGDAQIKLSGNQLEIGPKRVLPLCVASSKYPILKEIILKTGETRLFVTTEQDEPINASDDFISRLKMIEPATLKQIVAKTGLMEGAAEASLGELINERKVFEIGLTPTDILHVQGIYAAYDVEASKIGLRLYSKKMRLAEDEIVHKIYDKIVNTICEELINQYLEENMGTSITQDLALHQLLNKNNDDVSIEGFFKKPLVCAGACSYAFIPKVAERLHTTHILSEHSGVCNALGCIVGTIAETVRVNIRASLTAGSIDSLEDFNTFGYQVLSEKGMKVLGNKNEAIEYGKQLARDLAIQKAEKSGAIEISVKIDEKDRVLPVKDGWAGGSMSLWAGTEIIATALGRPRYGSN